MRLEIEIPEEWEHRVRQWIGESRPPTPMIAGHVVVQALWDAWPTPKCGAEHSISAWCVTLACVLDEGHEGRHSETWDRVTVTWSDKCEHVLQDGDRDVVCALPAGHDGQHRNGIGSKQWTDPTDQCGDTMCTFAGSYPCQLGPHEVGDHYHSAVGAWERVTCSMRHPKHDGVICDRNEEHEGQHSGTYPVKVDGTEMRTTWDGPLTECRQVSPSGAYTCRLTAGHQGSHWAEGQTTWPNIDDDGRCTMMYKRTSYRCERESGHSGVHMHPAVGGGILGWLAGD